MTGHQLQSPLDLFYATRVSFPSAVHQRSHVVLLTSLQEQPPELPVSECACVCVLVRVLVRVLLICLAPSVCVCYYISWAQFLYLVFSLFIIPHLLLLVSQCNMPLLLYFLRLLWILRFCF